MQATVHNTLELCSGFIHKRIDEQKRSWGRNVRARPVHGCQGRKLQIVESGTIGVERVEEDRIPDEADVTEQGIHDSWKEIH
jgi:hypothetical protein